MDNERSDALESALLRNELSVAATVERVHGSAVGDAATAARQELRFDEQQGGFVERSTGRAISVGDWLKSQRESRSHWFRSGDDAQHDSDRPDVPGAVTNRTPPPEVPGRDRQPSTAPLGKRQVEMSAKEWHDYRRRNPSARVVSSANKIGQGPTYVVDVGSNAKGPDVGSMSLDEYRAWRESMGMRSGWAGVR